MIVEALHQQSAPLGRDGFYSIRRRRSSRRGMATRFIPPQSRPCDPSDWITG